MGVTSQSPRSICFCDTLPARASATRWPAEAPSTSQLFALKWRIRTDCPPGSSSSRSPFFTSPALAVPVTTSPTPLMLKLRSIDRRKPPVLRCLWWVSAAVTKCFFSASSPCPDWLDTAKDTCSGQRRVCRSASTCCSTSLTRSASTRSTLLITTHKASTPKISSTSICSRVCGMGPSSAATTSRPISTPLIPEIMVLINRLWPGTSINPSV